MPFPCGHEEAEHAKIFADIKDFTPQQSLGALNEHFQGQDLSLRCPSLPVENEEPNLYLQCWSGQACSISKELNESGVE